MNNDQHDNPWIRAVRSIAPDIAARAGAHDREDRFVADSFAQLRAKKLFSAGIPVELGGGGASHAELCRITRELAHACGSTALAFGMHTHPLAFNIFKYKRGQPAEKMLRKVAEGELIICGTGANDWMESSGRMEKVDGGFRVTATKHFVSGAPAADLLVTSARYDDAEQGAQILHFAVPMNGKGVRRDDVWRVHGMRGTGSEDVVLDGVFVADDAVAARRPRGRWHPMWNAILPIALPIFMAAYVGLAEAASEEALAAATSRGDRHDVQAAVGEMLNELLAAQLVLGSMVAGAADYGFEPSLALASRTLAAKTLLRRSAIRTVELACEIAGGAAFFRDHRLERISRDIRAAHFHPLPERAQRVLSGRVALEREPIASTQ